MNMIISIVAGVAGFVLAVISIGKDALKGLREKIDGKPIGEERRMPVITLVFALIFFVCGLWGVADDQTSKADESKAQAAKDQAFTNQIASEGTKTRKQLDEKGIYALTNLYQNKALPYDVRVEAASKAFPPGEISPSNYSYQDVLAELRRNTVLDRLAREESSRLQRIAEAATRPKHLGDEMMEEIHLFLIQNSKTKFNTSYKPYPESAKAEGFYWRSDQWVIRCADFKSHSFTLYGAFAGHQVARYKYYEGMEITLAIEPLSSPALSQYAEDQKGERHKAMSAFFTRVLLGTNDAGILGF